MKRAQVTEVSGRHVCVSGKWVTCIGNHTPSIGELVWTDGRCVYGNEQEGGGSSVLVRGGSKAVPILLNHKQAYLMARETCRRVGTLDDVSYMVHRKNHIAYFTSADHIADADFDSQGNLYKVVGVSQVEWLPYNPDKRSSQDRNITVQRNQEILRKVNFSTYYEQVKQDCLALRERLHQDVMDYYPHLYGNYVCNNGYVDSEGNWGAWLLVQAEAWLSLAGESSCVIRLYYIDEERFHLLVDTEGLSLWEGFVQTHDDFSGLSGRRFPIHDGYYFTIAPYQHDGIRVTLPDVVIPTVYTPQGDALFTGRFYMIPRFSILEAGAGRYLVDINQRSVIAGGFYEHAEELTYDERGIQLLDNGKRTMLLQGFNGTLRLRYLKDSQKWVRSIQ